MGTVNVHYYLTDSLSDWQAVAVILNPQDTSSWLDIYYEWKMARVVVRNRQQKRRITMWVMCSKLTIIGSAADMLGRSLWSFKEGKESSLWTLTTYCSSVWFLWLELIGFVIRNCYMGETTPEPIQQSQMASVKESVLHKFIAWEVCIQCSANVVLS